MQLKRLLLNYWPLLLILCVAIFFRFVFLDKVPNAIGGDEIVYILNSKALFITGHDIFGSWSPINGLFFQYPRGEAQAELPYILNSFVVGPLPFSIVSARLANVVLGIILVVVMYLVTKELLGKKPAIFAAGLTAINPWLVYMGRTAYETIPATLFYLLGLYVLLKTKGWKILWSFPLFVLAFYSYIATKVILLPFVLIAIVYCYFYINKKKYFKQYFILFLLCSSLVLLFLLSIIISPNPSRISEILTPNNPLIIEEVGFLRKTTIQTPVTNFLTNKYTIFADIVVSKTLKTFSFDYLFAYGDQFFSIKRHGLFYWIDSVFIILGSLFIFSKKRNIFFLLLSLIIAGVIPMVIHTAKRDIFSIHAAISYPLLIIIAAAGIWYLIEFIKKEKLKFTSIFIIVAVYIISAANFLNIYLYWFPMQGYFDFPIRVLSSYAQRASLDQKVIVYVKSDYDYFKKHLFYTNGYNKKTAQEVTININKENYTSGNVKITSCSPPLGLDDLQNVAIVEKECALNVGKPSISISQLKDGGELFQIFNDKLCKKYDLKRYPYGIKLADFDIEKLTNREFCETFISAF